MPNIPTIDTIDAQSIPRPKMIFFDIDDTLSRDGIIAPHNKILLEQLAKTDIKLVIATGRPKTILPKDILALLDADVFDAIICTNGQYSFDKKGIISHYPIPKPDLDAIVKLCEASNLVYKFDSEKHLAWVRINETISEFHQTHENSIIDPDYYKSNALYQCSVFFNELGGYQMQDIDFAQYNLKLVHWHVMGGDILPIDASKARGILDICQYFDIDVKDTMACGDGFNDLEMFDLVGYAVAMGDGQPALIERSDLVTGTIEEHGLQAVLNQFV